MGELRTRLSSKSTKSLRPKMASVTSTSDLPSSGTAKLVRCSQEDFNKLRGLNEAEIITLFTPFVPHPPSTTLAKDMDPFEPLGRALPRQVRHVPYRLDVGMTEMHTDFLPASGAIVVLVCATDNIISGNSRAFEQQIKFARDVWGKISETKAIAHVPAIFLLVSSDPAGWACAEAMLEFPVLVTINDYTTTALKDLVQVLFGH
jgi:hypothetical protein